ETCAKHSPQRRTTNAPREQAVGFLFTMNKASVGCGCAGARRRWVGEKPMSASRGLVRAFAVLLATTALYIASPAPASAQDEAAEEEEIVITGSRIRRDPLTNAAPVAELTRED